MNARFPLLITDFRRHVLTLMSGTAVAQAIPIVISPVLTRLYSPEEFGVLALYMSIAAIMAVLATANYEAAVMLPKNERDAVHIVILSAAIALAVSTVLLVVVLLFNHEIAGLLQYEAIAPWLYMIPLGVLLSGLYQTLSYWSNRNKLYSQLAISRVVQSGVGGSVKLLLGFIALTSSGLIVATVTAQLIATLYLGIRMMRRYPIGSLDFQWLRIVALARKYGNFLKYTTPGAFFQTISTGSISIIINMLFNTTVVGLYYFANLIVRAPLYLIFTALAQVFHQRAVEIFNEEPSQLRRYTHAIQSKMLLFLLPFILVMGLVSPWLFEVVFGEQWRSAGEYLRYFLPLVFFSTLYTPISSLVDILSEQRFEMVWKISFFIFQVLSLYIGSLFFSFEYSILIMSIFGSVHYLYIDYHLKRVMRSRHEC